VRVEFLSPLDVRKIGGRKWQLLAALVFSVDGETRAVPAQFVTDFASVPRLPMMFLLAGDTAHRAATVHDYLYSMREHRALADDIFRAAMAAEHVPAWRRWLMHQGVRLGGAARYSRRAR